MEALERAEKAYTQYLTAEERSRIHTSIDLSALVAQAQGLADDLRRNGDRQFSSGVRLLSEKAVLLEPFEKLLVGAIKIAPFAGSMIWGSVLFILEASTLVQCVLPGIIQQVLQMAKSNTRVFDEVLKFFDRFADEMGCIGLQKQTFSASSLVQSVVEDLYAAILDFWVAAVKYFRSKLGGLRARFKTFVMATAIEKRFDLFKAEIIDQKTKLYHATSAEQNAKSSAFYTSSDSFQQTIRQRELKDWLNAADYEHDLLTANDLRYQGTCEWIQEKQPYIDWASSPSSPFLYIYGIPGSGKTVLSSWIINSLRTSAGREGIILYHFFKDADTDKRTPLSAIRSFMDQLINNLRRSRSPLLSQLESSLENAYVDRSQHAGYADLWDFLSSAVAVILQPQNSHKFTFLMDAMDECELPSSLVSDLLGLAQIHPSQIRVLVTGRKSAWDVIKESLPSSSGSVYDLEVATEDVHDDIQAFVRHTISNVPRLRDHQALRDRLLEDIGRASNHQGMFLWAYFMCEEVKRQGDPVALQRLLDHLPRGLDAMYNRICNAIMEKDDGLGFSLSVLKWLVNSPRPMRFSELQDGLKLMRPSVASASWTGDAWFDETNDLLWSRQDIVDACCNLVTYSGLSDGDSFRLVHLSATQFFRSDIGQPHGAVLPEPIRLFVEDVHNAEFELASLCLQYLSAEALHSHEYLTFSATYTSFPPTKQEDFLKQFPLFQFSVVHWPDFVLAGISTQCETSTIPNFLTRVFGSFQSHSAVIVWFIHAIKLLEFEAVIDILEQLANTCNAGGIITTWGRKSFDIMTAYKDGLPSRPEMIRKCWPMDTISGGTASLVRNWQIAHEMVTEATGQTHRTLPDIYYCVWMHYEPRKDLFLGIEEV
ncbi:hypothetical protein H0H93_013242 [Arthromyces matolae]|nr:hypothetical protein H0H93_013242 [Arthromyces matolae]